ncbi:MAG: hypothetical protein C0602_03445 [Denitrovibrio sp.]|nr:MAG: hypothetical protein C0602_03445 [Denitrovibrio sp.]
MKETTDRLKIAVETSQREEEFPDYLAVQVIEIADNIELYSSVPNLLEKLIFMVLDYNTYAETCCEKIGTSHMDIERILRVIHTHKAVKPE